MNLKRLNTMTRLKEAISPLSWLIITFGFSMMYIILLRPSAVEFVIFLAVDTLAFFGLQAVDKKLFSALYPDVRLYFNRIHWEELQRLDLNGQVAMVESMASFPRRRALYCTLVSLPKCVPAAAVAVLVWKHDISNGMQLTIFAGIAMLAWSYFYGAVFIESHLFVSAEFARIHEKVDWSGAFRKARIHTKPGEFRWHERFSLVSIWALMLTLQAVLVFNHSQAPGESWALAVQLGCVGLTSLMMASRIGNLGHRFFQGGLESLFSGLDSFDPKERNLSLPLHSSEILARFETIFNDLMERLRDYEGEMTQWVLAKSEESRYRAIGEVAGLVVHDLSGPLHVIQFCVEEARENPEKAVSPRYLEHLLLCTRRCTDLTESLKAYLKSPKGQLGRAPFAETSQQVVRLLELQYFSRDFSRIQIQWDPRLLPLWLQVAKPDLIHIFGNLLSNSIENLLDNECEGPRVSVSLLALGEAEVVIGIADNGTGLSPERFAEITSRSREGMGLRLVHRLVDRLEGSLKVGIPADGAMATELQLTLPLDFSHLTEESMVQLMGCSPVLDTPV